MFVRRSYLFLLRKLSIFYNPIYTYIYKSLLVTAMTMNEFLLNFAKI